MRREANYSTDTFYKHVKDKREIFLAAYETWVASEWKAVASELAAGGSAEEIARRLVALSFIRGGGLRSSLLELVFADSEARRFYRQQRRRQLDMIAGLRAKFGRHVADEKTPSTYLQPSELATRSHKANCAILASIKRWCSKRWSKS